MNHDVRRDEIQRLRTEIDERTKELHTTLTALLRECPHHFVCSYCGLDPNTDECAKSSGGHLGALCDVCGKRSGWYCPSSPDHTCHYFSHLAPGETTRHVVLVNGTKHFLFHYAPQYETEDSCIFCGEPDERK